MTAAYTHDGTQWVERSVHRWSGTGWEKLGPIGSLLAILRPTGRRLAKYTVSATDPAADYTTIGAAIDAARAAQKAAGQQTSIAWNGDEKDIGPDYRVDIVLGPGTYTEVIGPPGWINFYGATGNPDDVVITSNAAGEGTVRTWGPAYFEGITIRSTEPASGTGQKYPLHLTSGPRTTAFVDCKIITTNTVSLGSGAAIGQDGDSGSYTVFYGCDIQAIPGADWATNMHGKSTNTAPLEVVFVNCSSNRPVVYDELASGQPDRFYWIGGTANGITVKGAATVTTIDSAAVTGTVTAANVVSSSTWPAADGGVSARDRAHFYPSKIGTAHDQAPVVTDAAPMTVVADRVYYVPVPISEAIHATSVGVEVTTAAGAINTYRGVQRGGTAPEPLFVNPAVTTLTTGVFTEELYYFKDLYPGDTRVWVRLRFSAAAGVMGSVELPGLVPCYYEDQPADSASYVPNLIRAPAGTAFPLAILRSKS